MMRLVGNNDSMKLHLWPLTLIIGIKPHIIEVVCNLSCRSYNFIYNS